MKACPKCSSWIPGAAAFCPSCGAAAPPADPAQPPARQEPSPQEPAPNPEFDAGKAEARVRRLGTVYLVAGAVLLAFVALSFLQHATGQALGSLEAMLDDPNPDVARAARITKELYLTPWFLAVTHVVPFLFGVLFCWSGVLLRNLRGWTLGVVTSAAMIVFGVLTFFCCCVWAPLGIWGLMVLTKGDSEAVLNRGAAK